MQHLAPPLDLNTALVLVMAAPLAARDQRERAFIKGNLIWECVCGVCMLGAGGGGGVGEGGGGESCLTNYRASSGRVGHVVTTILQRALLEFALIQL